MAPSPRRKPSRCRSARKAGSPMSRSGPMSKLRPMGWWRFSCRSCLAGLRTLCSGGSDAMTEATPAEKSRDRVFLVVVDETHELKVALRYACIRARKTGGRVALLAVVEPADAQDWMGVNELMREEARMAAEQALQKLAADVQK